MLNTLCVFNLEQNETIKGFITKGFILNERERSSSFIILNDEDMPKTGLKLGTA